MELLIQTVTNMLILSAVYILVALGFAFILNMLGIFNLAHGAIFMTAGYLCYLFVAQIGISHWIAFPLTIITITALGIFLERFCFRPFIGDFNRQIMICVAITVILTTTMNIWLGTSNISIPTFVTGVLGSPPYSTRWDRVAAFVTGAIILVLVTLFVNRTRWGAQMQAVTQNLEGAVLQGVNFHHVAAMACAIGCALAAMAGIFMGSIYSLSPFMGDLTLVKVLMLVILAGVGSFHGIFIVGLILGAIYAGLPMLIPGAASDVVAAIIVLIILLIRPQGFFGYESIGQQMTGSEIAELTQERLMATTRKWTKPAVLVGLIIIAALLPLILGASYMLHILILTFVYVVASVSFRAISISGQFSIAHAAFMGIGAYVAGMASIWLNWQPWFTIPMGAIAAMVVGLVFGYPFSRLRAIYYAMGSLFFGVVIVNVISTGGDLTGGYSGLAGVHPIFVGSRVPYYYLFMGLALVSIIALYRFEFSRIGTTLKAIAQSHLVASSVGINESKYRILAVGVGCFFVGLVGATYAHYNMVLSPSSFNLGATLWIIMYVLIGGIDSFAGPIIGTFILVIFPEFFRSLKSYSPYIYAGILIIIVYLMPQGLVGLPQLMKSWYIGHRKGKRVAHAS